MHLARVSKYENRDAVAYLCWEGVFGKVGMGLQNFVEVYETRYYICDGMPYPWRAVWLRPEYVDSDHDSDEGDYSRMQRS